EVVAEGLRVGTSVIPVPGTSVVSLAAESATLNELTGGKFALGIGVGGYPSPGLRAQLGLPPVAPVDFARDYVSPLCTLFRGETLDFDGALVHLHGVKLGITAPPV